MEKKKNLDAVPEEEMTVTDESHHFFFHHHTGSDCDVRLNVLLFCRV